MVNLLDEDLHVFWVDRVGIYERLGDACNEAPLLLDITRRLLDGHDRHQILPAGIRGRSRRRPAGFDVASAAAVLVSRGDALEPASHDASKRGWEASHPLNRGDKPANC